MIDGKICYFCGKGDSEVDMLVNGLSGCFICDSCVKKAMKMVSDSEKVVEPLNFDNILKPSQLKAKLDEYVIGQDNAKTALSVAVYNHYKRLGNKQLEDLDDTVIQKSNAVILGSTGSGKTYLLQTLAKFLDVPFAIADATTLTQAGYVGEDVENIVVRLLQAADYDVEKCEHGIVYIDEIDKVARKGGGNPSITRDVSGEGVQQALLKIIEGTKCQVPPKGGRKHPDQDLVEIDTTNILFVVGGAFVGIDEVVKRRLNQKKIGFGNNNVNTGTMTMDDIYKVIVHDDLIKFGLMPEFIGRIPIIKTLETLSVEALKTILTVPKNALIKQYKKLFKYENCELNFTDKALNEIAEKAIKCGTGARGLRSIVEDLLNAIMYDLPDNEHVKEIQITEKMIKGEEKYVFPIAPKKKKKKKEKIISEPEQDVA